MSRIDKQTQLYSIIDGSSGNYRMTNLGETLVVVAAGIEVVKIQAYRITMGQNQVILRHQKFTFPRARE